MDPPSYVRAVVDRNVGMRRVHVLGFMRFAYQVNCAELLHKF